MYLSQLLNIKYLVVSGPKIISQTTCHKNYIQLIMTLKKQAKVSKTWFIDLKYITFCINIDISDLLLDMKS